jgi:uncharacterized membrane protein
MNILYFLPLYLFVLVALIILIWTGIKMIINIINRYENSNQGSFKVSL